MPRPLLLTLCAVALAASACGDDNGGGSSSANAAKTTSTAAPGGCARVKAPAPRANGGAHKPTTGLAKGRRYAVVFDTSCGKIEIRLDQRASPHAAASFASLARTGFFNNTMFHRIVPGFVIQGGDPTASGTGGPGYSTVDKPAAGTTYTRGTVAMAKGGTEPAGTAGSQFYIVTAPDAGLPPDYAVIGKVTSGQTVVQQIGKLGDPASGEAGTPVRPVVIKEATVSER
jgi:peptidyl-prolyl cis-trans isomerase B (cyclophilin B)